jgi:hypothetical protein
MTLRLLKPPRVGLRQRSDKGFPVTDQGRNVSHHHLVPGIVHEAGKKLKEEKVDLFLRFLGPQFGYENFLDDKPELLGDEMNVKFSHFGIFHRFAQHNLHQFHVLRPVHFQKVMLSQKIKAFLEALGLLQKIYDRILLFHMR